MTQPSKFHQAISKLLGQNLLPFKDSKPSRALCLEMYVKIFNTFVELFENSPQKISNEGMNYLAQQYYDSIEINGNGELDPNIFDKRASLKLIETKELALLAMMVNGTDHCPPIIHEIKMRS